MPKTKTKQKTLSQLKKEADRLFSKAIRYRDCDKVGSEWYGLCITCSNRLPMGSLHCGHFMSRRYGATRYDDENCNAQCSGCNTFRYGEQYKYGQEIDLRYGKGTATKLYQKAHDPSFKLTRDFLEQVIADSKEEIRFYEKAVQF